MKITNIKGKSGTAIANQFIISEEGQGANGNFILREFFQSYDKIIVEKITWKDRIDIKLDSKYWNYSNTTSKYRNQFLNETTDEIKKKIDKGIYIMTNLNGGN